MTDRRRVPEGLARAFAPGGEFKLPDTRGRTVFKGRSVGPTLLDLELDYDVNVTVRDARLIDGDDWWLFDATEPKGWFARPLHIPLIRKLDLRPARACEHGIDPASECWFCEPEPKPGVTVTYTTGPYS